MFLQLLHCLKPLLSALASEAASGDPRYIPVVALSLAVHAGLVALDFLTTDKFAAGGAVRGVWGGELFGLAFEGFDGVFGKLGAAELQINWITAAFGRNTVVSNSAV